MVPDSSCEEMVKVVMAMLTHILRCEGMLSSLQPNAQLLVVWCMLVQFHNPDVPVFSSPSHLLVEVIGTPLLQQFHHLWPLQVAQHITSLKSSTPQRFSRRMVTVWPLSATMYIAPLNLSAPQSFNRRAQFLFGHRRMPSTLRH